MAVDDVHHLVMQGSLDEQLWQQSFYYKLTIEAADPIDNDKDLIDGWLQTVGPSFKAATSEEMTIDCGTSQKVFPLPLGNTILVPFAGENGDLTGESLPATVAAIITTLTAGATAQTRGRKYVPGIRELDQAQGRIVAIELALLVSLGTAYENTLTPQAPSLLRAIPVIAHRRKTTPRDVLSTADINDTIARPRLGNQRRRRTFRTAVGV